MARVAVESGIEVIAATPHLHPDFPDVHVEELRERCEAVREALAREDIPLRVVSGAEVSLFWALEASDSALRLASYDQRGTDLLVETPMTSVIGLDRFLFELRGKGFRVTLAHPERNSNFHGDAQPLKELVSQGVLLQVNSGSLVDAPRRSPVRRLAERLCREGFAHALASDGHRGYRWRPVSVLAKATGPAASLVGPERARWMAEASPAAIVAGKPLPEPPPVVASSRGRRLSWRPRD